MRVIFLFFLWLLIGCGGANNRADAGGQKAQASSEVHGGAPQTTGVLAGPAFVLAGCYEMTLQRDTAFLFLQVQDTVVSGNLRYNWHERDGNVGTIRGVLRDSLIVADYTFQSEGLTSVREVYFKISGSTLLQGAGQLEDRKGKTVFRQPSQLQYLHKHPFVKVPCPAGK